MTLLDLMQSLKLTPEEHVHSLYDYGITLNGHPFRFVINEARDQWITEDHNAFGDGIESFLLHMYKVSQSKDSLDEFLREMARTVAANRAYLQTMAMPKRLTFTELEVTGRKAIFKPYNKSVDVMYVPGLSLKTLNKYCYVAYISALDVNDDDEEVVKYRKLIKKTDDLNTLKPADRQKIHELFRTYIALPNVNRGWVFFRGQEFSPYKAEGYSLVGEEKVGLGEKCYVYENMLDFLSLMERRSINGTEMLFPPEHHLILNGAKNLKDALQYLHDNCDFLDVCCMFPNDEHGKRLLPKVLKVVGSDMKDGSNLYGNYVSLTQQLLGNEDAAILKAKHEALEKEVDQAISDYHKMAEAEATAERNGNPPEEEPEPPEVQTVIIPSVPKINILDEIKRKLIAIAQKLWKS